jgi:hypothetical protein
MQRRIKEELTDAAATSAASLNCRSCSMADRVL